ncbi:MAG: hypothetical protein ACYC6M_00290 [Terriglobales bacterium]
MKCDEVRQAYWENTDGAAVPELAVRLHVAECPACAEAVAQQARLHELLEIWQPDLEFSPQFDRVLEQRIRAADGHAGVWPATLAELRRWLAAPVNWSASMSWASVGLLVMLGAAVLMHPARGRNPGDGVSQVQTGAVVRDLQVLDRDRDLIENFDLLSQETPPTATPMEENQ